MGGTIGANLQGGEVTLSDIQAVFPQDEPLVLVRVSQDELRQMLEEGIAFLSMAEDETVDYTASNPGSFPQASGIRFTYDPTAPAGQRVTEMKTEGTDETILLACPLSIAEGDYGYSELESYELTEETLVSAMAGYFEGETISVPETDRITRVGTAEDSIIGSIPGSLFWLVIAVLIICCLQRVGKKRWLDV